MPQFSYTARSSSGERIEGSLVADDRRSALSQIERMGYVPVAVSEGVGPTSGRSADAAGVPRHWRGGRMGLRDVLTFSTELRDLVASGMKLSNALGVLSRHKTGRAADAIVAHLSDEIIQGRSLSAALAQHPASFSPLYVNMVRAGEASGALGEVLDRLVKHYERLQEVKEKVIMALVYPVIVLALGIATLIFSMVFVIPRFSNIFRDLGSTLPLPTRILIGISEWLLAYGWLAAAAVGILAVLASRAVKTRHGRFWWHGLQLKMPLIRGIVASSAYAQFAQTLATLLSNGVPVLQALGIVEQTVGNAVIANEIRNARTRVTDGTTISGPLAAGKVFPSIITDMLAVGEETGDISSALNHVANRYRSELDRNVKIFTTTLEPILIVLMAVMVGFVAISMLMAVFDLTQGLNV
jgi:type II secretory pathway component PulF